MLEGICMFDLLNIRRNGRRGQRTCTFEILSAMLTTTRSYMYPLCFHHAKVVEFKKTSHQMQMSQKSRPIIDPMAPT